MVNIVGNREAEIHRYRSLDDLCRMADDTVASATRVLISDRVALHMYPSTVDTLPSPSIHILTKAECKVTAIPSGDQASSGYPFLISRPVSYTPFTDDSLETSSTITSSYITPRFIYSVPLAEWNHDFVRYFIQPTFSRAVPVNGGTLMKLQLVLS